MKTPRATATPANKISGAVGRRARAAYTSILCVFLLIICIGCATAKSEEDPCKDCPFTNRPARVWQSPELQPAPDLPELVTATFSVEDIEVDPRAYIRVLTAERLALMASVLEHRHLYLSLSQAVADVEGTLLLSPNTPARPGIPTGSPVSPPPDPPHGPP